MDAGAQCKFVQDDNMESQRVGLSFACAMVSAAWISAMFLALAVAAYANYTIYQLRESSSCRATRPGTSSTGRRRRGQGPPRGPGPGHTAPCGARGAGARPSPTRRPRRGRSLAGAPWRSGPRRCPDLASPFSSTLLRPLLPAP
ncbi:unnamed protein product, partial [Prorocentrum cordatum]